MDDFICDIIGRVCEPCYKWITVACPSSIKTRNQIFDDGWHASRKALLDPTKNPPEQKLMLNQITQLVIDMLVAYKSAIENYNMNLTKANNTGFSPVLEKRLIRSEIFLARLALWLMNDVNLRISLTIENCLDLDRKIIDGVMGWKENDRKRILEDAKSVFISNYDFVREYTKDNVMPKYLISALLDETLGVSSSDEAARVKTDLFHFTELIDANIA